MTHADFIRAYENGTATIEIDRARAARYVSARLMLPLVAMPVLGIGIALALTGWIYTGLIVIAVGVIVPRLIKHSAQNFVLMQSLQDEAVYREVTDAQIMRVGLNS